jgi:predicted SnoaL-like aldol condensation-catalyzing enzyme
VGYTGVATFNGVPGDPGNFVLLISEGLFDAKPTAFYDLYRIENGKQVEHWDVLETIPPTDQWKNPNGKF